MKPLIESCRKAIAEEKCLGCINLENPDFVGNPNCEYAKKYEGEQIKWNLKK